MKRKAELAFFFLLALVLPLAAKQVQNTQPKALPVAGGLVHSTIDLDSDDSSVSYRLNVTDDLYGVILRVQKAEADLDISVSDQNGKELWQADGTDFNERLFLYRLGKPALENGNYTLKISYVQDFAPSYKGKTLHSIDFDIDYRPLSTDTAIPLNLNKTIKDRLDPDSGMFRLYELTVPSEKKTVRVDAFGSPADIDIYGQVGESFADPRESNYYSESYRPREFMVIPVGADAREEGLKGDVPVYVMVLAQPDEVSAPFTLRVSLGDGVPSELLPLPDFSSQVRSARDPRLEKALRATVEILSDTSGGSGSVISPDGWILTNYHVIKADDGHPEDLVSVGFSLDSHEPPDTQFWARVMRSDETRDLALLKIVSGFYDQDIPEDYQFPSVPLGDPEKLEIGDTLHFSGYPTIGGLGSRATITMTEGAVSGFQDRGFGVLIKTAALISSGNSGGAALDGDYRLIGLPTSVVGDDSSQLAYIHPVDLLPQEWRVLAGLK